MENGASRQANLGLGAVGTLALWHQIMSLLGVSSASGVSVSVSWGHPGGRGSCRQPGKEAAVGSWQGWGCGHLRSPPTTEARVDPAPGA